MNKKSKISLITNKEKLTYEVNIEIKNDKINYQENNDELTSVLYDKTSRILIRDNKEIYMEYDFNMNKASIYIKDLKKEINLELRTKNIVESDKLIDIEYLLDNEVYRYIIDMEWYYEYYKRVRKRYRKDNKWDRLYYR